jgi:hypothetical protein
MRLRSVRLCIDFVYNVNVQHMHCSNVAEPKAQIAAVLPVYWRRLSRYSGNTYTNSMKRTSIFQKYLLIDKMLLIKKYLLIE